ncbi:MAG: glycosyltransferase family 2 protein [Hyphomicrobiaceae bacterium]|nr:glycosyltransferase family 2 protein [Hyphomicrobiaceae bacterium]
MTALPAELTIVVPTYKERDNAPVLIQKLDAALVGIAWEVVFVDDDSPDGTARVVKDLARQDPRVRCIRRVGRRGLAGACIEGMLASAAPYVAVMDADLQHDETVLPRMLEALRGGSDLAVGSRYVEGGSSGAGFNSIRQWGSDTATSLARRMLGIELSDPMSGFFMLRRELIEDIVPNLSKEGFKILLDIVASSPEKLKTTEVAFNFRERHSGESKLDSLVTAQYLGLLVSKMTGGLLPIRFLMFALVGLSGIAVHLVALTLFHSGLNFGFEWAQLIATVIAMTYNFVVNNAFTYRDKRLKGMAFWIGLLTFYAVCSFGTLANVSVASWIHGYDPAPLLAGFVGALMSAVFNYAASKALTWRDV